MINVYSKTTTVFDNNGLATLIPTSCEFSPSINGGWTLTMEHPLDVEYGRHNHLVKNNILRVTDIDCIREWDNPQQMFRIYDTKKSLDSIIVIAFPLGMEAQYDAMIESLELVNKTGVQAASELDSYVRTHDLNTKYTISSNVSKTARSKFENTNLISAISGSDENSFVNKWGGEVIYDNYKIKIRDVVGDQSHASSYPIRYGRNLLGLTHEEDMSSVITRLYPISSDDVRLNTWTDVTDQGGDTYVDSTTGRSSEYPFIRAQFVEVSYSLLDTNEDSISETHAQTEIWKTNIINTTHSVADTLWATVKNDVTNNYNANYMKKLFSGDDGIVKYLQNRFVFAHKNWQSFVKSCVKQGVEWIKSDTLPDWEWHEDTSVEPHAWWYGDNSVTPAVSYAKNCYVKIGKYWEYFNDDGYWLDYRRIPDDDMEWHEAKDGSGRKWFGSNKKHYAHNEFVYVTVEGQMKEWWYDSDGWYDEDSSGDSDFAWHQDSYGWWFGEEDAGSEDKNKYLHDCWRWIDGNYYWFDQYGYANSEDPDLYKQNYEWGDLVDDNSGKHWFGNPDEGYGVDEFQTYLISQWAKISDAPDECEDGWCCFDSNGWLEDMTQKKTDTVAWFANTVYNGVIDYVKTQLTAAYTLLFTLMTNWCNSQFTSGLDAPTVNVTVDLIDLSNTNEYSAYAKLERIALGDKVLVIGKDGSQYEERVVGLTYDCIRKYNTKVEIGALSKSVFQVLNASFKSTSDEQKLIAGDNVVIDGKFISVGDYVGRVVGVIDILLNNSSIVNGNLASFGIAAGENISISRSGNIITINSTGGGDGDVNLYTGINVPDVSLGDDDDIYLKLGTTIGGRVDLPSMASGGAYRGFNYTVDLTNKVYNFWVVFYDSWEYHGFLTFRYSQLTVGKTYRISFNYKTDETPVLYGVGELYGATIQYTSSCIDGRNVSGMVTGGEFKRFTDTSYGNFEYQSFIEDNQLHTYTFDFVAESSTVYFGVYGDRINMNSLQVHCTGIVIGEVEAANEIEDVYYKVNGGWLLYEGGETYEAGDNILIEDNVISGNYQPFEGTDGTEDGASGLVPQPLATDVDKFLKGDGTWAEVQGGGGGGGSIYREVTLYNANDRTFSNIALADSLINYDLVIFHIHDTTYNGSDSNHQHEGGLVYTKQEIIDAYNDTKVLWLMGYGNTYAMYTLTDYQTLTADTQVTVFIQRITGVKFGNSQVSPIIYSTQEREVGVWKDNKPLYAKVVDFGGTVQLRTTGTNIVSYLPSDIEMIVDAVLFNTEYSYEYHVLLQHYNNQVTAYPDQNVEGRFIYIQYTKTTDVAGSGAYNTLGVPNEHYDGNEKVIGTWVDGKPLYQKTISFTVVGNGNYQRYDHEIDDVDMIFVDQSASFVYYGDATYPLIGYGGSPQSSQMAVLVWSGGFDYRAGVECNGATCYATLKYTKTTT